MQKLKEQLYFLLEPFLLSTFLILIIKILFWGFFFNIGNATNSIIITTLGLVLFLLSPAYFLQAKARKIYLFTLNFLGTIFIIGDLLYYRYFATPVSVYVFMQSANLADLGPSIFSLLHWSDLLFLADLPILAILNFIPFSPKNKAPLLGKFALISGLLLALLCPVADGWKHEDGVVRKYTANDTLYAYGPLGFHFIDLFFFVKDQNIQLTPQIRSTILDWFALKKSQTKQAETSPYQDLGKGKNLIVIQVESLQSFVIGKSVNGQEITPNLNKLQKNSLYFPHFYPQTIGGNSSDAELIINTSLFPLEKGSTFFVHPNNVYHSLPLLLKEKGYEALAIHADEANFWNRHQAYPNLGFKKYYSIEKLQLTEEIGMGLSDEEMFKQAIPILQAAKKPFYAMIITLTSHYPYYMPGDKAHLYLEPPLAKSDVGAYLQSISYTDHAIGQFIEALRQSGLLENSIVVVYGDHDGLFKRDQKELEKVWSMQEISDEEWIRDYAPVPLFIYADEISGKTVEAYGGQIDFLPTISHIMGIGPEKHPYAMGNNLLTVQESFALVPQGDYNDEPVRVSSEQIDYSLNIFDLETLKVADLMIKTNFCAKQ